MRVERKMSPDLAVLLLVLALSVSCGAIISSSEVSSRVEQALLGKTFARLPVRGFSPSFGVTPTPLWYPARNGR